jgi:sec-independent protein translocase protein TatA
MNTCVAVFGMGGGELIVVFAAILILFGAKKIPEFAKGLGQGIKEFKKASREVTDEIQNSMDDHSAPRSSAPVPPTSAPPATVPKA